MQDKRNRIIALIATAAFGVLILLLLVSGALTASLPSEEWPPKRQFEIVLDQPEEEEVFVQTISNRGDNVTDATDSDSDEFGESDVTDTNPTQTSHALHDRGNQQGTSTPPVATNHESPAQVKPNPKPGNTQPNPDQASTPEASRQQQSTQNASRRPENRFSGQGKGQGKTSDTDGTNASNGSGGGTGTGMTMSLNRNFRTSKAGTLVFEVIIMPNGTVKRNSVKGPVTGSGGDAATDPPTIEAARKAASECRFSRREGETTMLTGKIIFTIQE